LVNGPTETHSWTPKGFTDPGLRTHDLESGVPRELAWDNNCAPRKHEGDSAVQRIKVKKFGFQSLCQASLFTCSV